MKIPDGVDIKSVLTEDELKFLFEFEQYQRDNGIVFYKPSPKIEIFHQSKAMYRLLAGGNRTGKTFSGSAEDVWYALGVHPHRKIETPNHGWVVSRDYKSQTVGAQKAILDFLPRQCIRDISHIKGDIVDSIWIIPNGKPMNTPKQDCSKITFKSCDSGVDKFGGAALRWIHFDEEPSKEIYQESIARIGAGIDLDIWLTMTPIWEATGNGRKIGMSWAYHDLWKKADNKRIFAMSVGIDDNAYLSKEQKDEQKKKYHGVEYDIRIKGEFKLLSGNCVFDGQSIEKHLDKTIPPEFIGSLGNNKKLFENPRGALSIWQKPAKDRKYFIGADVGLGTGGDPSCAYVIDDECALVAELHGQIPPDTFGEELVKLGQFYNDAWVGVEANSFGIATLNAMKGKYAKLYFRYQIDERSDHRTKKIGWWTDAKSKPLMISEFGQAVRDDAVIIPSRPLCEEMSTYVLDSLGTANAEVGCHDDRVIAAMISLQVRKKHLISAVDFKIDGEEYNPDSATGY